MGKRFYVVQTHPGQEEIAETNLANQHFIVFLPSLVIERENSKRFPWRGGSSIEPLFPGYLFAEFDKKADRWRSINGTRGVVRILGSDCEAPVPVPVGFVEELMSKCDTGLFDQRIVKASIVRAGQQAKVLGEGSFGGLIGQVLEARSTKVKMLLNVFGGAIKVTFGADMVAAL